MLSKTICNWFEEKGEKQERRKVRKELKQAGRYVISSFLKIVLFYDVIKYQCEYLEFCYKSCTVLNM
jgi:hypothetical protein